MNEAINEERLRLQLQTVSSDRNRPLVSIILFTRNAARRIRRSIESVCGQTYPNIQYVVQDGGSTDGTLDILKEYGGRLELVSAPDRGPADGFWRALNRCRGDIVGTCLSDEELMPDAVEKAIRYFAQMPWIGAITGDAHLIDGDGKIMGTHNGAPFNVINYLYGDYCPYWSSSFFSMRALRQVGIFNNRWSKTSLEFEIWCRLSSDYHIHYAPEIFSKYGIHAEQLSQDLERALSEADSRAYIIRNRLFTDAGFFGENAHLRDISVLKQYSVLIRHFAAWNSQDIQKIHERLSKAGLLTEFNTWLSGRVPQSEMSIEDFRDVRMPALPKTRYQKLLSMYHFMIPLQVRRSVPAPLRRVLMRMAALIQ